MSLIETLISSLVPILIQEAESLLGSKPDPSNHSWVTGLIQEVAGLLDKLLPAWIKPAESEIEQLVEDAVKKLLDKI